MTLTAFLQTAIPMLVAALLVLMLGALVLGTFALMVGGAWASCQGVIVRIRRSRSRTVPASRVVVLATYRAAATPAFVPPLVPQLRTFAARQDLGRN